MRSKIAVIGGGGHAKVVISILKKISEFEIIGYIDNNNNGEVLGTKYIGDDEYFFENFNPKDIQLVIGIGQIKNYEVREKIVRKYQENGFNFPIIISPTALVNEDVKIDEGTVVFDRVIINSGTSVGKFSIINTGSIIEHDCLIGNFTHIAPGAVLSGSVKIGDETLIGTGASIINNITICSKVLVPAGITVRKNISRKGIFISKR